MQCSVRLTMLICVIVVTTSYAQENDFRPQTVIPRAFPAIKHAMHIGAEDAKGKIDNDELVLGVEINGVARAYPINMLKGPSREIINDKLGDTAIAATW